MRPRSSLLALLLNCSLAISLACSWSQAEVSWWLSVSGNGYAIVAGSYHTKPENGTDFGDAAVGGAAVERAFVLRNTTNRTLYLAANPSWSTDGAHAEDFRVVGNLPSSLVPGASHQFTVRFRPSALGTRTTMLRIPHALSPQGPWRSFDFRLQGRGVSSGTLMVQASASKQTIAHGSMPLDDDGATDLGAVIGPGDSLSLDLILRNGAEGGLLQLDKVQLMGPHAGDFSFSDLPPGSLLDSGGQALRIVFRPQDQRPGQRQAVVAIHTSDAAKPVYLFVIYATVLPASDA